MANAYRYARFVPRLEALNARDVPSVTVVEGTGTSAGVVRVYGDQWANDITVSDTGAAEGAVTITVSDDSEVTVDQTYTFEGEVTKVVVCSRSGADTVSYELTDELAAGVERQVVVWLGNQHDSFDAQLAGLADGSSLKLYVYGGNGLDALSVTAAGDIAGSLDVRLLGQNGKDSLFADFAGAVSGDFNLLLNGGNGVDFVWAEVTVDAAVTEPTDPNEPTEPPPATGNVTVQVLGGNGKDDLTLLVDGAGADGLAADSFKINGGFGWDNFNYTAGLVTVVDREAK
jgi:hypothetical protein